MASLVKNIYESTDDGTTIQCKDFGYDEKPAECHTNNDFVNTRSSVMPPASLPPTLSRKASLCGFCCLTILFIVAVGVSAGTISYVINSNIYMINSKEGNDSSNSTSSIDRQTEVSCPVGPSSQATPSSLQNPKGDPNPLCSPGQTAQNISGIGSSYVRWGQKECRDTAELVYSGYAGGTDWYTQGGGSNFLCLPETPEYREYRSGLQSGRAYVEGVEYQILDFKPFGSLHNQDAPCAVCNVAQRGRMIMIPAKKTCPSGWTREYQGYLMSSRHDHKRAEFICVDKSAEALEGTTADEDGALWYPVEVRCVDPEPNVRRGGLSCAKYPSGHEMACVVCTK